MQKSLFLISLFVLIGFHELEAQDATVDSLSNPEDTLSGFDSFNAKMEQLFKVIPVPIVSYSTEAGSTFGLAKFNLIDLSKKDTISQESKLSEVVTFSTKGRVNASVSTELIFNEDKHVVIAYINYRKQPEYIFGIGNDVTRETIEEIEVDRIKFFATAVQKIKPYFYVGIPLNFGSYFNVQADSTSFLYEENVSGVNGGITLGTGAVVVYDSRENRYNPEQGVAVTGILVVHPDFISDYAFTHFELDMRKYFNPWHKHIIAVQATTSSNWGDTPFYEISLLGGDSRMRGYYLGAYRDNVLVDCQVEYRMPVWKIFGVTGWVGTGRVASSYADLSFEGWKLSFGGGLRIRVDTENNVNLRLDFGFGPDGISGTYLNFTEAF